MEIFLGSASRLDKCKQTPHFGQSACAPPAQNALQPHLLQAALAELIAFVNFPLEMVIISEMEFNSNFAGMKMVSANEKGLLALSPVIVFLLLYLVILGLVYGNMSITDSLASIGSGIDGMSDLIIITLLAGGMLEVVRHNGGMDYLTSLLTRNIKGARGAQEGGQHT